MAVKMIFYSVHTLIKVHALSMHLSFISMKSRFTVALNVQI
jgi:hypothetical protein